MGALERPDAASLSEIAPLETTVACATRRLVPALLSLFIAILYLDVFTFKGPRLFVRRADPATWRGFEHPYVVHRVYGVALAAPYLANVYLLARSSGLLGRAARDARRERTRIGLLYEKYFGYEGSHFVWKVFCFQIVEVALQAAGKIPLFNTYLEGEEGGVAFWFVYVFILALLVNVLYPSLLLRSRLVFNQRDLAYSADTFLDIVYALTPFVFMLSGIRSQAMLIPHEPVAYVSNLIPLMHAHFVIATLETAGERERALKRVAPSDSAKDVADAPNPVDDAKDSGAPEATPPGATPAGRRYRGLVAFCLGCWTLAMGFFYMRSTPSNGWSDDGTRACGQKRIESPDGMARRRTKRQFDLDTKSHGLGETQLCRRRGLRGRARLRRRVLRYAAWRVLRHRRAGRAMLQRDAGPRRLRRRRMVQPRQARGVLLFGVRRPVPAQV